MAWLVGIKRGEAPNPPILVVCLGFEFGIIQESGRRDLL